MPFSRRRFLSQIQVFAKLIHGIDAMTAGQLRKS
jgi:hypothetical protein